jgi:hypothetical protein
MLTALLLCLAADPTALEDLQGTWESVGGTQFVIDGEHAHLDAADGQRPSTHQSHAHPLGEKELCKHDFQCRL